MSQQGTRKHDHAFGQDRKKPGETRTLVVVLLTTATMLLEIVAGSAFGSMALLADGLHMASHAVALAIAVFAYVYARRHAHDRAIQFRNGQSKFPGRVYRSLVVGGVRGGHGLGKRPPTDHADCDCL